MNLPFELELYIPLDVDSECLIEEAYDLAKTRRNEFLTPEHLLMCLLEEMSFRNALTQAGADIEKLERQLEDYLSEMDEKTEADNVEPNPSMQFLELISLAERSAVASSRESIHINHVIRAFFLLNDSFAAYYLKSAIGSNEGIFMSQLVTSAEVMEELNFFDSTPSSGSETEKDWKKHLTCINELVNEHNPLIGREKELEKTIQILCRKEKNNPLHIGEPGVGKTALVYGLAKLIEEGKVPEKLKGSKIYQLEVGNLLAGTQFRGDFEMRIKNIMEGLSKEENVILYIDEIHNLMGAGATGEGSMDASNMLKPYLESGKIRFIGATTYDEHKRYFAKSKGISRRFSVIDIAEPSIEETIHILNQLKGRYEEFHKVKYNDDAIELAVKGSAKYINDRFLPDKAIDLMDEAGARRQIHPLPEGEANEVTKELVSEILAHTARIDSLAITDEDPKDLEKLEERIKTKIFGQEDAVKEVSEAVLMAKAGLTDESKPLASLLFVGPTGVGKTEVAKTLAQELGVELLRFDMSEYTEKHTVAKLIGSPAGYVGYEDGGLLTDAIRKSPNAVLLLDEIEKAHSDIYNILLQVMDYARLTDNKGNKADFRNVILIMTSNAGAQFAAQASVGFANNIRKGDSMMRQVKKTFKPEFINRLSATVIFNDMNREMAALILDKKLKELSSSLAAKNVTISLSDLARDFLLEKGFTTEYGAREIERTIKNYLKRVLLREILFGKLKEGGEARIDMVDNNLIVV